jgi:polyhydroxybutyrate depolymerase
MRRLAILAAAGALAALAGAAAAEQRVHTLELGSITRSYVLYLPERAPRGRPLPLLVALHGGGGTAEQMGRFSRFNAIAAREGFAVAYPEGLWRRWNDGRVFRGRTETDADDVGFIRAMVDDIGRRVSLDRRRIFAAGISNGGFMSFRLACEAADLFAAVAPVTATMPAELGEECRPSAPVSVLVINGTADAMVPYDGGHVRALFRRRGAIWSTERTLAFWARHNRCDEQPAVRALPNRRRDDGSHVIEADYRGCERARLRLLRVEGGGHTWPGGSQYLPESWIGPTNRDIDASRVIWAFFKSAPPR